MAEAKEKERPQWEMIQAKTFTKWCNMYLKRKQFKPINGQINEAFKTAIKLMQLINALYDVKMPKKYNSTKKCLKSRPMAMDNANQAMNMIATADIKTNYLKTMDIVDGEWKMMLGMIWAIILDFNIKGMGQEENKNFKEGLLIWCRKKTKGYKGVDGNLNNFSTDWKNGKAFAALVNRHYPDKMDYDPDASPEDNCEKAFAVCEELGVERLLDVEDITGVPKPDEKSVMTYVSELYKIFSKTDMKETSAKHIKQFLEFQRGIRQLQSQYEERAKAWQDSCATQVKEFSESKEAENATVAAEVLNAYKRYVLDTQPKMLAEKIELEELYTNIQSQLKVNKRVAWSTEITPEKLEDSYSDLYKAQKEHYDTARETRFKFVEAQKPTEISEEQMKEWNDAFDHFDVNNNNYLEFDEFSAALKAVGVPLTEEAEMMKFKELKQTVKPADSPTSVDCVNRDNFTGFLKQMYTADDTAESVLASMDMLASNTGGVKVSDLMSPPLDDEDRKLVEEIVPKNEDGTYDFKAFTSSQFAE